MSKPLQFNFPIRGSLGPNDGPLECATTATECHSPYSFLHASISSSLHTWNGDLLHPLSGLIRRQVYSNDTNMLASRANAIEELVSGHQSLIGILMVDEISSFF